MKTLVPFLGSPAMGVNFLVCILSSFVAVAAAVSSECDPRTCIHAIRFSFSTGKGPRERERKRMYGSFGLQESCVFHLFCSLHRKDPE
jgi:hypothetical protein